MGIIYLLAVINFKIIKNMFCKYCSKLIDDDSKFCKHCGKSVGDSEKTLKSFLESPKDDEPLYEIFERLRKEKERNRILKLWEPPKESVHWTDDQWRQWEGAFS